MSEIDSTLRKDILALNESSGKITPSKAEDSTEPFAHMKEEENPI